MGEARVAVLGAGPAGLGAAWQVHRQHKGHATVFEQRDTVGGNAGSFELDGIWVDYGSHRLHPACQPRILNDLRDLLAGDLLDRPRHGRIRLRRRWIHFPLKPMDLLLRLPWSFAAGVATDAVWKLMPPPAMGARESFASVLERGLGTTICRDFYFPYALKIWGVPAEELSAIQAHKRVSAGSLGKMARKVLGLVPGFAAPGAGRFYYPRHGYGQICRGIAAAAQELGADIQMRTTIAAVHLGTPHDIEVTRDGVRSHFEADYIWSTVPITVLARMTTPTAPAPVLEAAERIAYRSMVLIYLVLAQPQFTPFDAHYFPEPDIQLTRLSEPKNYSAAAEPRDRTVLCAELPCSVDDPVWRATDVELGELARDALARCDLPIRVPIVRVVTKRLSHAYPIYRHGYEHHFNLLDNWVDSLERVLTFGRQGLFAHDNTHHALAMAYAAADCLQRAGSFEQARWSEYRQAFTEHVVED